MRAAKELSEYMDYEKPAVPASWHEFAAAWAAKLGLGDKEIRLVCATERFGAPIILRLIGKGPKIVFTARSSDAADAAPRRQRFLTAAANREFSAIEIDMAGFYVEEALLAPPDSPARVKWKSGVLTQLLRIAEPVLEVPGEGEAADQAEDAQRTARVAELLQS
ncbi:MAG: hypothetical protein EPO26_14660 [Chloroflexota bacterium]|nr:MAG: hypothetical protein EPO26_14660 [Chloroflexota bacterium]